MSMFAHISTYKKRCNYQIEEWVKGNSIHNDIDDECCPDFSCCRPDLLQPEEIRKTFAALNPEQQEGMLLSFLSAGLKKITNKNVYVTNGEHPEFDN